VYVVGSELFAFRIEAATVDYRIDRNAVIHSVQVEECGESVQRLAALAGQLRMNFGAADFKTHAGTGETVFMEFNTAPMFAAFDAWSRGALAEAMIRELAAH
jgi:hypothetical protein